MPVFGFLKMLEYVSFMSGIIYSLWRASRSSLLCEFIPLPLFSAFVLLTDMICYLLLSAFYRGLNLITDLSTHSSRPMALSLLRPYRRHRPLISTLSMEPRWGEWEAQPCCFSEVSHPHWPHISQKGCCAGPKLRPLVNSYLNYLLLHRVWCFP